MIRNKEYQKAMRLGCILLIASAVIVMLALYGAFQLVANHIIPLL